MLWRRFSQSRILAILCLVALVLSSVFWLGTIQQPLIDQHDFRQTQTALTALFMQPSIQGILNYETPVIGSPWAIPFEFPLYQVITALIAAVAPWSMSASGRLVSLVFGLACLVPACGLMRNFGVSRSGRLAFILLYLTSSIYIYWNRSFMIESTALFLTLASLYCYSEIRKTFDRGGHEASDDRLHLSIPILLGLTVSLSLGLIVKATTALPTLLLIGLDWLRLMAPWLRPSARRDSAFRRLLVVGASLLVSFLLLTAWVHHADSLKSLNPIAGAHLTSSALSKWNYGSPEQRLSARLWSDVVIQRMLTPLGAVPAVALIVAALTLGPRRRQPSQLIVASVALALAPLLIFTNLHIVHNYYQAGNQIFLLIALASSVDLIGASGAKLKLLAWCLLALIIAGNIQDFSGASGYLQAALIDNSEQLQIGRLVGENTSKESGIVVYGNKWSSSFAFHGRRRALTIPPFYKEIPSQPEVLKQPEVWLGGLSLGAVITDEPLGEAALAGLERSCPGPQRREFASWTVYLCPSPSALDRSASASP